MKAKPIDNLPEKAQLNQRRSILKKTLNDRYIADNYYPSADMDNILFEKDGLVSKMKQFDYKVHKFIRQDPQKTIKPKERPQKKIKTIKVKSVRKVDEK